MLNFVTLLQISSSANTFCCLHALQTGLQANKVATYNNIAASLSLTSFLNRVVLARHQQEFNIKIVLNVLMYRLTLSSFVFSRII